MMHRHQSKKSFLVARQANTAAFRPVQVARSQRVNLTTIHSRDIKHWTLKVIAIRPIVLLLSVFDFTSRHSCETEVNVFFC